MTLIKSMTGYGRAVETVNGREFTVELRSVNNRYLDCSVRLPRMVSFAEDAVKQAVKASVSRGKVDVFISVRSEAGDEVVFDKVVAVGKDDGIVVGAPYVEGATVTAKVEKNGKAKKVVVFTYKSKKNEKRKMGHRQPYTQVQIEAINA